MSSELVRVSYEPPISQLLLLGKPGGREWRDYAALGISSENVPDLIRMATDGQLNGASGENVKVWAPVHAWRALGQLGAAEAVAPLLSLFQRVDEYEDDWVESDLPEVLGRIGAAAIEPAANYLADTTRGEWARITAADTLGRIGRMHPDSRAGCVSKLVAQLEKYSEQSRDLNAFLVTPLWDLRAVEAMPVIERAYAAGRVEEAINGDVEDVQIHFGLKKSREHAPKPNRPAAFPDPFGAMDERIEALERENAELSELVDELTFGPMLKPYVAPAKIGRNESCPCGSGKKYKKCCGA